MESFINDIDSNKVDSLMEQTENNVQYFENVTNKVVQSYSEYMDNIMKNIYVDIIQNPSAPIETVEKYFLELSHAIYFMAEKLEQLGVYNAMSKAAYKEIYNKAYLDNQIKDTEKKNKTTVAENQAVAENVAMYESVVSDIYDKAYKILKNKIDAAQTMVSTLSKTLSRRMTENQFSNVNNNTRQILNEEVSGYKPF